MSRIYLVDCQPRLTYTFPMQKTEKKQTAIKLDGDLIKDLKRLALDLDRTYTSLIEEGVKTVLEKYKKKAGE